MKIFVQRRTNYELWPFLGTRGLRCHNNLHALGANLPYFDFIYSVYVACSNHYPFPQVGTLNCFNWVGGGTEREVNGEDYQGGGGRVGGEKVKGQLSVVRQGMKKEWPRIATG